jgi:hypothetical protein
VLRGRAAGGRFDLSQSTFRFTDRERALRCLAVTRRGKTLSNPFDCLALTETGQHLSTRTMNGEVRCDLRGAFVVGGASRRAASVRARLDDGSTVAGRLFGSALGRAFLVSPRQVGACGGSRCSTGRASGSSATPAASRRRRSSAATASACSPEARTQHVRHRKLVHPNRPLGRCGQPYRAGWASRTRRTARSA